MTNSEIDEIIAIRSVGICNRINADTYNHSWGKDRDTLECENCSMQVDIESIDWLCNQCSTDVPYDITFMVIAIDLDFDQKKYQIYLNHLNNENKLAISMHTDKNKLFMRDLQHKNDISYETINNYLIEKTGAEELIKSHIKSKLSSQIEILENKLKAIRSNPSQEERDVESAFRQMCPIPPMPNIKPAKSES